MVRGGRGRERLDAMIPRIVAERREGATSQRRAVAEERKSKRAIIVVSMDAQERKRSSGSADVSDGGTASEHLSDCEAESITALWEIEQWINALVPSDVPTVRLSPAGYSNTAIYINTISQKVNNTVI